MPKSFAKDAQTAGICFRPYMDMANTKLESTLTTTLTNMVIHMFKRDAGIDNRLRQ